MYTPAGSRSDSQQEMGEYSQPIDTSEDESAPRPDLHPDRYRKAYEIWKLKDGDPDGTDKNRIWVEKDLKKENLKVESFEAGDGIDVYYRDRDHPMLKMVFDEFLVKKNNLKGARLPYDPGDIDLVTGKLATGSRARYSESWKFFRTVAVVKNGEIKSMCIVCKTLMVQKHGTSSQANHLKTNTHIKVGGRLLNASYSESEILKHLEQSGFYGNAVSTHEDTDPSILITNTKSS